MNVTARVLKPDLWSDVVAVFSETAGCDGCWCFNHHIAPGRPDVRGDAARLAKERCVVDGRAAGVVGYLDGTPVGWCAVDRRRDIPGHDCVTRTGDDAAGNVWAIHCFFVRERARGHGVARAMLQATLSWLRDAGATEVEAFPSPPDREPFFHGFGGPFTLYAALGFEQTDDIDENFCRVVCVLEPAR